jgi:hypothetical protein
MPNVDHADHVLSSQIAERHRRWRFGERKGGISHESDPIRGVAKGDGEAGRRLAFCFGDIGAAIDGVWIRAGVALWSLANGRPGRGGDIGAACGFCVEKSKR